MSLRDPRVAVIGALIAATIACLLFLVPQPRPSTGDAPSDLQASRDPSREAGALGSTTPGPANVGPLTVRAFAADAIPNPPVAPTAHDGQAKVWRHNDRWWSVMLDPATGAFHIFGLEDDGQAWIDTGVLVDDRPNAHADALVSDGVLYTVSATASRTPSGRPELRRFTYDPGTGWMLDRRFPVSVAGVGVASPSLARDGTGRLWVAFVDGGRVMVNASGRDDATWSDPWPLPGPGTAAHLEDVARIVAIGQDRVAMMWSNQGDDTVRYAEHPVDADPADAKSWSTSTALSGSGMADNHLDVATAPIGGAERVIAVAKTSRDVAADSDRNDPEVVVLAQRPEGGWQQSVVGRVQDGETRPLLLVDRERRAVIVATTRTGGSASWISFQMARLDGLAFSPGTDQKLIGAGPQATISREIRPRIVVQGSRSESAHRRVHGRGATLNGAPIDPPSDQRPSSRGDAATASIRLRASVDERADRPQARNRTPFGAWPSAN